MPHSLPRLDAAPIPQTTQRWTVWTVFYDAAGSDGMVEVGDRNSFQASSPAEVLEKLESRGLTFEANRVVIYAEHFETVSYVSGPVSRAALARKAAMAECGWQ